MGLTAEVDGSLVGAATVDECIANDYQKLGVDLSW